MSGIGSKRAVAQHGRRSRILVIDADPEVCQILLRVLNEDDHEVVFGQSAASLDELLNECSPCDAVLVDVSSAAEALLDILPSLKRRYPETEVICISQPADIHLWLEAIQRGAYEYLAKPVAAEDLLWILTGALARNRCHYQSAELKRASSGATSG